MFLVPRSSFFFCPPFRRSHHVISVSNHAKSERKHHEQQYNLCIAPFLIKIYNNIIEFRVYWLIILFPLTLT